MLISPRGHPRAFQAKAAKWARENNAVLQDSYVVLGLCGIDIYSAGLMLSFLCAQPPQALDRWRPVKLRQGGGVRLWVVVRY